MALTVLFPQDQAHWPVMEASLQDLATSTTLKQAIKSMATTFYAFNKMEGPVDITETPYGGLQEFVETKASEEEAESYVKGAFPMIGKLALEAGSLKPKEGLEIVKQGEAKTVALSRHFVASIVALGFLNLFEDLEEKHSLSMPSMNFDAAYFIWNTSQMAKVRMILNYFNRLSKEIPSGNITFRRVVLNREVLMVGSLLKVDEDLCPFVVRDDGKIEDAGTNVLQVDFANEYLGGGVLWQGNVQEEIRFSICPELLSSMLFMESMSPTEAVIIEGFEQFSEYSGYGEGLTFVGDYQDPAAEHMKRNQSGDILTAITAIDAVPYSYIGGRKEQYQRSHMSRDINKAYAGFLQPHADEMTELAEHSSPDWAFHLDPTKKRAVATGNWGCGVFGGDAQLKSMLQWMAASKAGCPALIYYTFSDQAVAELAEVVESISMKRWKIKDLMGRVVTYCEKVHRGELEGKLLFDFLTDSLAEEATE